MGVKNFNQTNTEIKYTFERKAGRSIIEKRPVFSPDGESLAVIVENVVRVYNTQTGECVRTLETESSIKELVSVQFPENEDYNLYGCSECGCITTWTWENGAVLRETKLAIPDKHKVITFNLLDSNECFVLAIPPPYRYFHIATYSTKTGALTQRYTEMKPLYSSMMKVCVGWCNGDRFAGICNSTKCIFIQNLNQPHVKSEILNYNKFRVLDIAAHSRENTVVISDTIGRVTVITGNLFDHSQIAREVLHWHFLPTMAVCFSELGNYLYSAGMERVLVKWTCGGLNDKANEKSFIPRLPGTVRYIVANNTNVAVTLSNNAIVIASTAMRVVSTILECGGLSPTVRAVGGSLLYHNQLSSLLVGGRAGHLQLYSTLSNKVLYNIDITQMNSIPPARYNLMPLETEVSCIACSGDGTWLVTSEYRNDGIMYPEEMLKFWAFSKKKSNPFKLNTCVNLSHGGCFVVSLALNHTGDICVSSGGDQKFRLWKRNAVDSPVKKWFWNCLTACYYSSGTSQFLSSHGLNNFKIGEAPRRDVEDYPYLTVYDRSQRNDIIQKIYNIHKENGISEEKDIGNDFDMGGVAISQDGSLIAAWFGSKMTVWDSYLCSLKSVLSHPSLRPKGVHVQFGCYDAAHYLVCTTSQCLAVWSLLSLTVKWLVQINPTYLTFDRFSNRMAITTTNNDVFVFKPQSSTPILSQKSLLDPNTGVFKLCTFANSNRNTLKLYLMRNNSEIYCLEPEKEDKADLEVLTRREHPTSNFSALLAEQQSSEVQTATSSDAPEFDINLMGNNALTQFLTASPHMVPPVSLMCTSFLQNISGQQEPNEEVDETGADEKMEVDVESSEDEREETKTISVPFKPNVTQLWTPNYDKIKEKRLKKISKELFLDLHLTETIFGE